MTLRIFNPEHDIALASGLANFTAPHAGRKLRHDLGFLAAFWAEEGDAVLTDDPEQAEAAYRRTLHAMTRLTPKKAVETPAVSFIGQKELLRCHNVSGVEPWGWDAALKALLLRKGVGAECLPTDEQLAQIRMLSSRSLAAKLLSRLRMEGTVGEAFECRTTEEVAALVARYSAVVLKMPWSSSGRGIRYVGGKAGGDGNNGDNGNNGGKINPSLTPHEGWLRNLFAQQGSVMVEPYYNKVRDFGMEFSSDGRGGISFEGLSLFHTENGAYTGSIVATETAKREMLGSYVSLPLLDAVRDAISRELCEVFNGRYRGPFGIDMMAVRTSAATALHPCVEINLRRTMGHVALTVERLLNPDGDDDLRHVMRIDYTGNNYLLKLKRL